jgi:hypothetical protein
MEQHSAVLRAIWWCCCLDTQKQIRKQDRHVRAGAGAEETRKVARSARCSTRKRTFDENTLGVRGWGHCISTFLMLCTRWQQAGGRDGGRNGDGNSSGRWGARSMISTIIHVAAPAKETLEGIQNCIRLNARRWIISVSEHAADGMFARSR